MLSFRNKLNENDPEVIRQIGASTGFFDSSDIEISVTLAKDVLEGGYSYSKKTHDFLLAEHDGKTVAYACFGKVLDAREGTYEIFWLSTLNEYRGHGIGKTLINRLIEMLKDMGAKRIYVKTDSTAQYQPTRRFYESCGFSVEATLRGYYGDSDDCLIYAIKLEDSLINYLAAE